MDRRRRLVGKVAAAAAGLGLAGCAADEAPPTLDLPAPPERPERQFAQPGLPTDADGNELQPRHHAVYALSLTADPDREAAATVERALRTIERAFDPSPEGCYVVFGWGSGFFDRVGRLDAVPIDHPTVLSRTDDPDLQRYDAVLLLESDVPSRLAAVESATFGARDALGGEAVDARLGEVFDVESRRTGFIGEGLPAEHAAAEGVTDAVPADAPMFTGFFSGRRGSQATEDRVAIPEGAWADGTVMHLSHLSVDVGSWWSDLDDGGRIARMFSPEFDADDVAGFASTVPFSDAVREHARDAGVVGHQEKMARVRQDGDQVLLRRDFNTIEGGVPGVHFVAFQRRLSEFRKARKAMNGWWLRDENDSVRDRENNGILDFVSTTRRANFLVPPRSKRVRPLLR